MNTTYTENILATYSRGTIAEIRNGANWYADAHAIALHIGNGNVWKGAGVIAVLSPRVRWDRNVMLAKRAVYQGYATGHTKATHRSAAKILAGTHPLDILKGDKVRAFCAAIATNGNSDIATIDRHAHDIAVGMVFTDKTRPNIGKILYRELDNAYQIAAKELNLSVSQVQAITWVIHRREKGIVDA